jgi:hypothetical protein
MKNARLERLRKRISKETKSKVDNLFTKADLEGAWMHGELRQPKELMHLNNFEEYFKHQKHSKSQHN